MKESRAFWPGIGGLPPPSVAVPKGVITFDGINDLIDQGVIENVERRSVNAASLNVTLDRQFLLESRSDASPSGLHYKPLSFSFRESPSFNKFDGSVILSPGEFCLASIKEKLTLPPDIACHVLLRSSAARMGIEHSLAGWADPGYSGNLTLEFSNVLRYHSIKLCEGDQICQLIFHRVQRVPADRTYGATGGKYSGDQGPQVVKAENSI